MVSIQNAFGKTPIDLAVEKNLMILKLLVNLTKKNEI